MAKITLLDGTVFEGTPTELVEVARAFEESKHVELAVTHTFNEGDVVRVLTDGQFHDIDAGAVGTILDTDAGEMGYDDPYTIHVQSDGIDDYFRPQDLEFGTPEIAEPVPLKVGDYAKVVNYGIKDGDIFKITEDNRFSVCGFTLKGLRVSDGEDDVFPPNQLVHATEEEVATAKAKAEADAIERKRNAIFTENGRKVNEYRKGDIVEFTDDYTAIGVVEDIGGGLEDSDNLGVRSSRLKSSYQVPKLRDVKPITFAESRLDRN